MKLRPTRQQHCSAHCAIALIASVLLLLASGSSCTFACAFAFVFAFVSPRCCPQGRANHPIFFGRLSTDDNNNNNGNNGVFFDNFRGGFLNNGRGDPSPSSLLSNLLQSRMGKVRGAKAAYKRMSLGGGRQRRRPTTNNTAMDTTKIVCKGSRHHPHSSAMQNEGGAQGASGTHAA